ncbi:hypothetical protein [Conchiformibius kuhniae]|uniref:Uncharacterized protein n=1 Tax=Conchiformibius kuhniae TaxID=211502 RepID=A0A8T9MXV0_9NEIS|nr:hypothetical protein [Conchiformibius kuhniae]UOP05022.1 hypothetical protein LVJ77_01495 [Conchiformibius kuhniae]
MNRQDLEARCSQLRRRIDTVPPPPPQSDNTLQRAARLARLAQRAAAVRRSPLNRALSALPTQRKQRIALTLLLLVWQMARRK